MKHLVKGPAQKVLTKLQSLSTSLNLRKVKRLVSIANK